MSRHPSRKGTGSGTIDVAAITTYKNPPDSIFLQGVFIDPDTCVIHHFMCHLAVHLRNAMLPSINPSHTNTLMAPRQPTIEEFIMMDHCECIPPKYQFLSLKLKKRWDGTPIVSMQQ